MGQGKVLTLFVCPHPGEGYPSPRFFPRSLVPDPFQGYNSPRFFPRSLVPHPFQGYTLVPAMGYNSPGQEGQVPQSQLEVGTTSQPGDTPVLALDLGYCAAGDMPRAVSRRRIFLFIHFFEYLSQVPYSALILTHSRHESRRLEQARTLHFQIETGMKWGFFYHTINRNVNYKHAKTLHFFIRPRLNLKTLTS